MPRRTLILAGPVFGGTSGFCNRLLGMPYLIDSDVLIAHREGQPGPRAVLEHLTPEGLAISIVTFMEVYQGTLKS